MESEAKFWSGLQLFCQVEVRVSYVKALPLQQPILLPVVSHKDQYYGICLSVTLVYCGQTIGWIKMKLGMEIGLDPGHIVLDGNPALVPERGTFYFQLTFKLT